ncbi:S41 family peptidase [Bacillus fonticola]|uniref:S41 family peptidase n=1 Tax=Bacillus fonticola TaxID=2728853 RepID=UPI001D14F166|nr:S41 family peptidase [Bacillus fonticola]
MKTKQWALTTIAATVLAGSGGWYAGNSIGGGSLNTGQGNENNEQASSGEDHNQELQKIAQAYDLIHDRYVNEVGNDKLVEGAIQGMLTELEDPYSVYMNEETAEQFSNTLESSFEGIGAEVSEINGDIVIVSPFKNSPAEEAGLKPNDRIVKVDGEDVTGQDLYDVTSKIRGEQGTDVELTIEREGVKENLSFSVKRDEIPIETVYSKTFQEDGKTIGYLEVTSFSEKTGEDFTAALKNLEDSGMDGLILDVRGNPGGLLSSVQEILDELVTDEKPYVQIEERSGKTMQYFSDNEEAKPYPISLLIDEGSASASEILAGALKETGDYTLIGEKTFGKGTVQQAVPMGDGSNIKLTLYKWLTPDGNWIHSEGIEPDVQVKAHDIFQAQPVQAEKTLTQDMNNEQVARAQFLLKSLGFAPGREDGYFDEGTSLAVKAFQAANKLTETGELDAETVQVLQETVVKRMEDPTYDLPLQMALKRLSSNK